MGRLDEAADKMQVALNSLEQAVESMERSQESEGPGAENQEIRQALDSALQENENLQSVATAVSTRLDQAVVRIKQALGQ